MIYKTPTHTKETEKAVCDWLNLNSQKRINDYSKLSNAYILTEILSKIDSNKFDVKQLWRMKDGDKKAQETAFSWNNLAVLEEYIKNAWEDEAKKSIFDHIEIDFSKIYKDNDKNSIHQLVCLVFLTIILLSKNEAALDLIQSIHSLKEPSQELMKNFVEDCVTLYTQITQDSKAESIVSSPSRFIGECSKNYSIANKEGVQSLGQSI